MSAKSVCVIGAGLSGLSSLKSCLEEGLDPKCYEIQEHLGGLWKFSEESAEGRSCVMRKTIINSSKEMCCPSDYPLPEDAPNFMNHTKMIECLEGMAQYFNLVPYIHFNKKIISVIREEDYELTGRWKVTILDTKNNTEFEESFDGVMVCSGLHSFPMKPRFPGQDQFEGNISHSQTFKNVEEYKDQNVLVIGGGNSAVEVATEASNVAKKTYLSTRSGMWIMTRNGPWGIPWDYFFLSRLYNLIIYLLPLSWISSMFESYINFKFDHAMYGIKPKDPFVAKEGILNEYIGNTIINGEILVRGNVEKFTKNGVFFVDETSEVAIDKVVLGTGYRSHFLFVKDDVVQIKEGNRIQLYKFVFPPDHLHPTLAFIGHFQPRGSVLPISKLQARWVVRIFSGKNKLPPLKERRIETTKYFEKLYKRFGDSPTRSLFTDAINYMDEIATLIGCKPNLWVIFFTDPILFYYLFFGGCVPFQYRLKGPGAWEGARRAILTSPKRISKPLRSKGVRVWRLALNAITFGIGMIILFLADVFSGWGTI